MTDELKEGRSLRLVASNEKAKGIFDDLKIETITLDEWLFKLPVGATIIKIHDQCFQCLQTNEMYFIGVPK